MNKISPTKFVTLWLQGKTNTQIAKYFGVPATAVSTYAYKLRKMGVKLPKHSGQKNPSYINVDYLNEPIRRKNNEA